MAGLDGRKISPHRDSRDRRPGLCDRGTPRKMLRPKREGVTGDWGKLHSGELHYLVDYLKNKIGGSCGSNGEAERCMQGFCGET